MKIIYWKLLDMSDFFYDTSYEEKFYSRACYVVAHYFIDVLALLFLKAVK